MKQSARLVLLLCLACFFSSQSQGQSPKNLTERYRHWLDVEVPYIISTDERKEFLRLHSDGERDQFITAFWQARNPDPNFDLNTYREEHYRRLSYANSTFGSLKEEDGWRTDMGRIYITLGPPQQRAPYHLSANIRDMEIWFYQGNTPALPAFFYVVFFRPGSGEEYRLYSPRQDGPAAITSTGQRDNKAALEVVKNGLGNEVARTLISLNPAEPVDLSNPVPSMESDLMLSTIRNLADNPLEREKLSLRRARERVTSSILTTPAESDLVHLILRDSRGSYVIHDLFRIGSPNSRLVGQLPDKSVGYKTTLHTVVLTAAGQPVYQQQAVLTGKLTQPQAGVATSKSFAAEDRLALVPGSYEIEATLTNNLNLEALRWREKLVVPEPKPASLGISDLLVYGGSPIQDKSGLLPFDFASVRFAPRALKTVAVHPGGRLPLVFQIWLPADPSVRKLPVHLHYVCGSVAAAGKPPVEFDEDVDTANADEAGNLVTGHTLDVSALPLGTYRLIVRASQESPFAPAYSTLTVRVVPPEVPVEVWTAYGPTVDILPGSDDLRRGLSAEAQGKLTDAERFYTDAVHANSADQRSFAHLAALLARLGKTGTLAGLGDQPITHDALDPSTLVLIAGALQKQGKGGRAIELLNAQLKLQEPSAPVYQALAELYDAAGDRSKATDAAKEAQRLRP